MYIQSYEREKKVVGPFEFVKVWFLNIKKSTTTFSSLIAAFFSLRHVQTTGFKLFLKKIGNIKWLITLLVSAVIINYQYWLIKIRIVHLWQRKPGKIHILEAGTRECVIEKLLNN